MQVSLIWGKFLNCCKLHIPHLQSEGTIANLTEIQESIGVKQEGPLSSVNAGLHGDELLEWSGGTKGLLPGAGILPGLYLFSRTTITQYHSLVA